MAFRITNEFRKKDTHSSVKEVYIKGGQGEPREDPEERPKDLGVQEDPCIHIDGDIKEVPLGGAIPKRLP